jgi:hypothetical protein
VHWLKESFFDTLRLYGFEGLEAHKVEYDWDTELHDAPPDISLGPYPWDWLIVAKVK